MWKRLLKPSEMFITEIVSNKFCNIDVDKCDYLLRDFHYVRLEILDFEKFMNSANVVYIDGISHVGYHTNDFLLIENMFTNRAWYHMNVYQLPETFAIEKQVLEICLSANLAGLKIDGYQLTEIQKDCQAYLKLNDSILDLIRDSDIQNPMMAHAQDLLRKMDSKKFFTFIYEATGDYTKLLESLTEEFGDIFCTVVKRIPNASIPENIPLYDDDFKVVQKISDRELSYESTLIFCKTFDAEVIQKVQEFIEIGNNNFWF